MIKKNQLINGKARCGGGGELCFLFGGQGLQHAVA